MAEVSIVIPTKNRPQLLNRAINSILKQTYENWELFIINDAEKEQNSDEIKSDILEYANNMWSDGYDVVLVGHYHLTGINMDKGKRLIWLGDWIKYFSVTIRDENGWKQLNWNESSNLFVDIPGN